MVVPASSITLGELITYVKRQFGDESGVQIDDSDIVRWANKAALDIGKKNSVIEATASQTGVANQKTYDISALLPNVIRIVNVSYGDLTLEPSDQSGIKKMLGGALAGTGTPTYWYIWANQLNLWPIPNTAELLTIDFIATPQKVSSAGNLLPLPDIYYDALCSLTLGMAYELDEDTSKSNAARTSADQSLRDMTDIDKTMSGSFPVVRDDYEGAYYDSWSPYYGTGY